LRTPMIRVRAATSREKRRHRSGGSRSPGGTQVSGGCPGDDDIDLRSLQHLAL
jgi:hypothetical protein